MVLPTFTVLDISTAHITAETADALGQDMKPGRLWNTVNYLHWHEYGWIIYIGDDDDIAYLSESGFSDLAACMRLAKEAGCQYLKLDCDGTTVEELPTYVW